MELIQVARKNICSFLEQCNVAYKVNPFDEELYQECIDDAVRRGYPVDGPVRAYLRVGLEYGANPGGHLPHRPTQIWIALYTGYAIYVDDSPNHMLEEMSDIYLFNDRFIRRDPQGSGALDAFADLIHRASDVYRSIESHLIITSTMRFVAATLLEHETRSMKISGAAEQYPTYQRTMSGIAEAYSFFAFPREIPLNDYIQAIPEMTLFVHNVNDLLSFYKEERVGETANQISTLAARTKKSKLEAFTDLTETTIGLYKRILEILEESPEACEVFQRFTAGYVYYHTSSARYQLKDLELY